MISLFTYTAISSFISFFSLFTYTATCTTMISLFTYTAISS
jgi:hypothetical protein